MDAHDQAEEQEAREFRRFQRLDRLWRDILAAERAARATARLEHALRVCCRELTRRPQAPSGTA